tara:strand:- start:1063 stop:1779 length:717 start_codon:yes stop_codon:yes gene_type:complete
MLRRSKRLMKKQIINYDECDSDEEESMNIINNNNSSSVYCSGEKMNYKKIYWMMIVIFGLFTIGYLLYVYRPIVILPLSKDDVDIYTRVYIQDAAVNQLDTPMDIVLRRAQYYEERLQLTRIKFYNMNEMTLDELYAHFYPYLSVLNIFSPFQKIMMLITTLYMDIHVFLSRLTNGTVDIYIMLNICTHGCIIIILYYMIWLICFIFVRFYFMFLYMFNLIEANINNSKHNNHKLMLQ